MQYETVIGLEVHAQLLTKSKMFCACSTAYQEAAPNTHVCPVCLGMPGVLPIINRRAVEYAMMLGLAVNCTINHHSKMDRKNYPYPDLMKGYQISQYDEPLCSGGWLDVEVEGTTKHIGITRVHMEEDTAKLSHNAADGETYSLVDVNRGGVPLMEIVSEPDMRSAEEARQYLTKLRSILRYLGISSGDLEQGAFRCDANVSVRPLGAHEFGTKVEVKNMNSFRSVFLAIQFEEARQREMLDAGQTIRQETRGWVDNRNETVSQRSKEMAHDYRYFPEPDIPSLEVNPEWVAQLKAQLPELPEARRARFEQQFGLSGYEAGVLTATRAMAEFFEATVTLPVAGNGTVPSDLWARAKWVSNWCTGELMRLLNAHNQEIEDTKVTPASLAALLDLMDAGKLNQTAAKTVFEAMFTTGKAPVAIMEEQGLAQMSNADELTQIVIKVIADTPQAVADYKAGKQAALGALMGKVMKETRGRANAGLVTELLKAQLD